MSVYLSLDGGEPIMLASNKGWGDVGRWADGLDVDAYGEVVHLTENAWSQELPKLEKQLRAAVKASKPKPTVKSTLADLLSLLANRGSAEVVTINNGTSPA
jgi:hypothetical protein